MGKLGSARDFFKIVREDFPKVLVITGPEKKLWSFAEQKAKKFLFGSKGDSFPALKTPEIRMNVRTFFGDENPCEPLLEELGSYPSPLFSESGSKLLIVKNAEFIKDGDLSDVINELLSLIKAKAVQTYVILFFTSFDGRKKTHKKIQKELPFYEFSLKSRRDVVPWVRYLAKTHGISLSNDIVNFLLDFFPQDLQLLENEIIKISLRFGSSRDLSLSEVIPVITGEVQGSIFDLVSAIVEKDFERFWALWDRYRGQEPAIIALLARHFRILYEVRIYGKMTEKALASKVKVPPFFIKTYLRQATSWNEESLLRTLRILRNADIKLKSMPQRVANSLVKNMSMQLAMDHTASHN